MAKSNPDRIPEKIKETDIKKEKGYLYYIDEDGDVSRVPTKWNKDPKFIEKVKEVPEDVEIQPSPHISFDETKDRDPNIIYEDKVTEVRINEMAVHAGHTRVISKSAHSIRDVTEGMLAHLMTVASVNASMTFEALKAQGTNIILNQEGQINISVIPRSQDDGLNLFWDMKPGDQNQIKATAEKIKDKLVIGEIPDYSKVNLDDEKVNIIEPLPEVEPKENKNYLLDQIRRIP